MLCFVLDCCSILKFLRLLSLKKRLPASIGKNSQTINVLSDTPYYLLEDDFLKATPRKSIEELKDCKEDGFYIVFATVKGVINGPDWWYKAVIADSGMYYYERCYSHVVNMILRYRIKIRVIDETDSATFVLWDRNGCFLLKKSRSCLLECIQNRGGSLTHPPEFDEFLIEKSFLFKVEVKNVFTSQFEPSFKPDMTVSLSFDDTYLSMEFQDVQSSASKDLMQQFCQREACLGSQAENCIPNLTHLK